MIGCFGLFLIDPGATQDLLYVGVSISRIVYGYICIQLLWGAWSNVNDTSWHHWVLTIVIYMLSLALIKLISFIIYHADTSWHAPDWIIFAKTTGAASIVLLMLWWALLKPNIFDEARTVQTASDSPTTFEKKIYSELIERFKVDKLYLEWDLKIENVAKLLKVSNRDISKAINKIHGDNFRSLLRQYRITYACEILKSNDNQTIKIIEIAMSSGYSTKSVFNAAFKSQKGMSPTEFRNLETGTKSV
jgi:AraC-like DNA-binding protein